MITNQSKYKHIKYGLLTSDINGCGWIAAYNALQYFGIDKTPEQTAAEMEKSCLWLWGLCGTHPDRLARYLCQYLYIFRLEWRDLADMHRTTFKKDAGILFYWTKSKRAHYVFFTFVDKNQIEIYNHDSYNMPVVMDKNDFFKDKKYSILLLLSR